MEADRDDAQPAARLESDRLSAIARPVDPVAGTMSSADAERLFAERPNATSLVIAMTAGELAILSRRRFMAQMAGRLGYGRSLHHRKPVELLVIAQATLSLDVATTLADAGAAALARPLEHRYDDLLVDLGEGGVGLITMAELFAELSLANGHRALHDALTGLPNRAFFFEALRRARDASERRRTDVAVLFVDLDGFKSVNDSLGHAAGDQVLVAVGDRLRSALRGEDIIARLGGDEFGVLLRGTNADAARITAARLQQAIADTVTVAGRPITVSASVGIAADHSDEPPECLVRDADLAMYRAKRSGGGGMALYEPEMHARAVAKLEIASHLRGAAQRGELALVYQPIVTLPSGSIVACEALLRWTHPELGAVSPARFVPVAERSGEILEIGHWVLSSACAEAASWPAACTDGSPLLVAVNIAVRQAMDGGFAETIVDVLDRTGLAPERLVLEITESAVIEEGSAAITMLSEVSKLGVKLVLDDFGTGFSSLSHLQRLPIDSVKIDRSFVQALRGPSADSPIIRGVIGMAQGLGLNVVAEGVEMAEQAAALRRLGCARAQGYFFARPQSAADVRAMLDASESLPRGAMRSTPAPVARIA